MQIFAMALLYGLPENEDDQPKSNSAVTLGASLSTALLKVIYVLNFSRPA
jgi:hypothetical protein